MDDKKTIGEFMHSSLESFDPLISFMEHSDDFWGIKDAESRFVYGNKIMLHYCDLPPEFDIAGKLDEECPAFWSEYAPTIQANDRAVRTTGKRSSVLNTFIYGRKDKRIQPFLVDIFPLYQNKKCIGTAFYGKKLEIYSMYHYARGENPDSLILTKPDEFFTDREFDVVYFLLQSMNSKEIAKRLNLSHRTIENKLSIMYQKAGVTLLSDFKEFCRIKGYDRYAPSRFINPDPYVVLNLP